MIQIKQLSGAEKAFSIQLDKLLASNEEMDASVKQTVETIINDVRQRGDVALLEHTNRLDRRNAKICDLEIPAETLMSADSQISDSIRDALIHATARIRNYHEHQHLRSWSYEDDAGNFLGQQVSALDRVGVYVPGGKASYPSSVLMNVIPATVAGVEEVIMVVPAPNDVVDPIVLAAAKIAGVNKVFTVGGAQAVAALAYGTETIPAVDKIVGPGNRYVAAAKRLVFGQVGIDMVAGPSEILIVTDGSADPEWVVMDMFAQAEHDEDARAILVSTDAEYISTIAENIERLLPSMERADIIQKSLESNGAFILVQDLDQAMEVVNRIAPEHLELAVNDAEKLLPGIRHAGAIFIGHYAAEALGDYCAGPNHVLPTGRSARFSSPLGVYDFQKRSSLIKCNDSSVAQIAKTASVMARGEGLTAHARSAELRLQKPGN